MMDLTQQIVIRRQIAKDLIRSLFKNDYDAPFEATDGQADIFNVIFTRAHPRNQIIAATQYGKSEIVSMAVLLRSITFKEKFAIVAGQKDKAMIIMGKMIQHIFDNEIFVNQLEIDKSTTLEKIKHERSKERVTWKDGGEVQVFTANSRNRREVKNALTGFGSQNIIEDEASLIPDDVQAMILRMLGGQQDNFLVKIGNPFHRNHFLKTWNSDKYYKILIDYKQALLEGRYSIDYIEEMRNEAFFDVLYECKFPARESYITGGYVPLISEELLSSSLISADVAIELGLMEGKPHRLGADYAGGGNDRSAYVARWPKCMKLLSTNNIADTMQQVVITENLIKENGLEPRQAALDAGGLGQGIADRMKEKDLFINAVMFGQAAPDSKKYKNARAYMYYQLQRWLKEGGKIIADDAWYELLSVNMKQDSESRFTIQPKKELKKVMHDMGINVSSPDVADAAALTFADNSQIIDEDDVDFV